MIIKLIQRNKNGYTEILTLSNINDYTYVESADYGSEIIISSMDTITHYCGGIYDEAFIMNDNGKTIDRIELYPPKKCRE